ncbi:hypothetical protein JCGZ_00014 [Jatropha curcas]|uniref:Uncharacterized protein n=1 Tax=Jatropha curcas TaxID=180498 RepID=A0A067JL22_JATCU|nr:hypothetical protein JCGZ_00014 [Jatropha curcas]
MKPQFQVRVKCLGSHDSTALSSDSVSANGTSFIGQKEKNGALIDGCVREKGETGPLIDEGDGRSKSRVEKKWVKDVSQGLKVLWDDGYGTNTVKDYLDVAKDMIRPDGGPPRWFCPVECGKPLKNSPILLFLPGNRCPLVETLS